MSNSSIALATDLTITQMFVEADIVVKVVMALLLLASLLTWTVAIGKTIELREARRRLIVDAEKLMQASTVAGVGELAAQPARGLLHVAADELARANDLREGAAAQGLRERLAARVPAVEAAAVRRMNRGTGLLASIGATAPFIGLFGTVWGIMNSFVGIAQTKTTNLAVVAPGIAEALLATAMGLVAAIPAVLIYNGFARAIAGYRALLADVATAVACLVSREIERCQLAPRGSTHSSAPTIARVASPVPPAEGVARAR